MTEKEVQYRRNLIAHAYRLAEHAVEKNREGYLQYARRLEVELQERIAAGA